MCKCVSINGNSREIALQKAKQTEKCVKVYVIFWIYIDPNAVCITADACAWNAKWNVVARSLPFITLRTINLRHLFIFTRFVLRYDWFEDDRFANVFFWIVLVVYSKDPFFVQKNLSCSSKFIQVEWSISISIPSYVLKLVVISIGLCSFWVKLHLIHLKSTLST